MYLEESDAKSIGFCKGALVGAAVMWVIYILLAALKVLPLPTYNVQEPAWYEPILFSLPSYLMVAGILIGGFIEQGRRARSESGAGDARNIAFIKGAVLGGAVAWALRGLVAYYVYQRAVSQLDAIAPEGPGWEYFWPEILVPVAALACGLVAQIRQER